MSFGKNVFGMNEPCMILNLFLKFERFEPGNSYKLHFYKRSVYNEIEYPHL